MDQIKWNNSYSQLPSAFYKDQDLAPVRDPKLIQFNHELSKSLGLSFTETSEHELAQIFSGSQLLEGSKPIAMAYAGHQFGNFVPQLGDGRALLLGEVQDASGKNWDIQLKGSGPTVFSRRGDGRSALGPVIREYVLSEAMWALGVPTTRSLAAVLTGESVQREELRPGGVLTRVASSHLRVGTFEYFAARGDHESLKLLLNYALKRHFPEALNLSLSEQAEQLLKSVLKVQSQLVAQWMSLGFIHGVMNTDNFSISGETIDYGPCAFMDHFDFNKVYSSIDVRGRYAYSNQPGIAHWNLTRLAEALLPLLSEDESAGVQKAESILNLFPEQFESEWLRWMKLKLGLQKGFAEDRLLIQELLDLMHRRGLDFTNTFLVLGGTLSAAYSDQIKTLTVDFNEVMESSDFKTWLSKWQLRLKDEGLSEDQLFTRMKAANPVLIPRNHLVEEAIRAGEDQLDFSKMIELIESFKTPYELSMEKLKYMTPPRPEQVVHKTFCGT